jgi:hypothetical protein
MEIQNQISMLAPPKNLFSEIEDQSFTSRRLVFLLIDTPHVLTIGPQPYQIIMRPYMTCRIEDPRICTYKQDFPPAENTHSIIQNCHA